MGWYAYTQNPTHTHISSCVDSNDLTQGVRASMRAVTTAEQGMREGASAAADLVTATILPAVRSQMPRAAGIVWFGGRCTSVYDDVCSWITHPFIHVSTGKSTTMPQGLWKRYCSVMQTLQGHQKLQCKWQGPPKSLLGGFEACWLQHGYDDINTVVVVVVLLYHQLVFFYNTVGQCSTAKAVTVDVCANTCWCISRCFQHSA